MQDFKFLACILRWETVPGCVVTTAISHPASLLQSTRRSHNQRFLNTAIAKFGLRTCAGKHCNIVQNRNAARKRNFAIELYSKP